MRLILIRHGESVGNREGFWQGQLDYPLTANGVKQARLLAEWLADEKIDALYSSDLVRAKKTAEFIAAYHGLPVTTTPLLREINLGRFQGLTRKQVEERYPEWAHVDWHQSGLEDVEQIGELFHRAKEFIHQLWTAYKDKRIVAVTHGGFINGLLMALLNISWQGKKVFTLKNTSMTTIQFIDVDQVLIHGVNETPHLSKERQKGETGNQNQAMG